jgi:hypothetical protein
MRQCFVYADRDSDEILAASVGCSMMPGPRAVHQQLNNFDLLGSGARKLN